VLSQSAVIAVLALAQLLVIITRGIDLSVGSTLALSAVVEAGLRGGPVSAPRSRDQRLAALSA
jgi:ribose transport system permease protein